MIKNKIKNARGVSLISLAITVTVLIVLSNIVIYNIRGNLRVEKLKEMQSDISNLRDKVSSYYAQNGQIPVKMQYNNIGHMQEAGIISNAVDTGAFYVLDLSSLENLTLNRGQDFENIKNSTELTEEQIKNNTNLYIINEVSHNIFYVEGVTVDNETFYTDYSAEEIDKVSVDLRYVDNIKIPEGYYYVSGTKEIGILIRNADNTERYKWILIDKEITEVPTDVEIETAQKEDFIKSVNAYKGYYKSMQNNRVIYLDTNNISPMYDEEQTYTDKNGNKAYIPKGFQVSEIPGENTINEGLVVKDAKGNEWVWIEVPKSIYTNANYNEGKAPTSSEDYEKIESIMQKYAQSYRHSNYRDEFSSTDQHGFENTEKYNEQKYDMLRSVYEHGGFYIGRYEAGTETARFSDADKLTEVSIQKNLYPYNFVSCRQAQEKATELSQGERKSSLMFGIQWDLVLKFIDQKGVKLGENEEERQAKITNSADWGNYVTVEFPVTAKGKYTLTPKVNGSWKDVPSNYNKPSSGALLTTGASERNSVLNIYDFAGNVWEWTLEFYSANKLSPCTLRGGSYENTGNGNPVTSRSDGTTSYSIDVIGFRPTLW